MIPIQDKGESRQLFEWVSAKELKEIDWPLCIKLDGGGAPHYVTVCSMEELQSHVSHFNSIEEIQFARPIPQSSLKEEPLKDNKFVGDLQKQLQGLYDAKYKILESGEPNELFRSFYAICEREGKDTNWPAITARIKTVLELQHTYANQSSLTPKSIRDSSLKLSHADITRKALEIFGDEDSDLNIKQHEAFIKGAIWVLAESVFPTPNPNKLSNSEIQEMAENYGCGSHTAEQGFIAGCKAIIELNKK